MFIYELKYEWYEDYKPYLFILPNKISKEEWSAYCDQFLPYAFEQLTKGRTYEDGSVFYDTIGWDDLCEAVAKQIETSGVQRIYPCEVYGYWGSTVGGIGLHFGGEIHLEEQDKVLPEDLLKKILDYNIEVNEINRKQTEEVLKNLDPLNPQGILDILAKDEDQSEL